MKWFTGEVSIAIQKAIKEKKVFIVFVKDEKDNSTKMEEVWNDDQMAEVCTDEKCVAINIAADSVPGKQFGAIYPILCVPSTYLINNQGTPTDIIPGVLKKEEFIKRLQDAIDKTLLPLLPLNTESQNTTTVDNTVSKGEDEISNQQPTTSSAVQEISAEASIDNSNELSTDVQNTNIELNEDTGKEENGSSEVLLNDDLEAELTTQEKSQIAMLREKLKLKKEEEEKQKLKDIEKKRRENGQDLQIAQRQIAERQALELAKEIADRKSEEKAAREKVREQIRQDRLDKTKRFDREKKEREEASRKKTGAATAQTEKKKVDTSNTARLQFRLPDGSSVSNQFNAEAKFLVAESFIKDHLHLSSVRLTTVYPKHEFASEDMVKSFRELGLLPNASIIVSPGRTESSTKSSLSISFDPMSFIMFVLAPIFAILNWIASLFTGNNNNENQSGQSTASSQPLQSNPRKRRKTQEGESNQRDDSVRRRNIQTDSPPRNNIQSLRNDDDDENATWNGNSTQQM